MIKLSVKKRLAIFLSGVWILFVFIDVINREPFHFQWAEFLGFGIFPIFIIWGIYWVISGFKRDTKTGISKKTYKFFSNATNKASPESELFIGSRISQPKSESLSTTAQNEKPTLQDQEEYEKPKFQNREEYEKWKAEKIRNIAAKQNQNKYDKSKYKICTKCNKLVDKADGLCQCGYNFDEPNLDLIRSIKRKRIFKICIAGLVMISIGTIILVPSTEAFFGDIAEILGGLFGTYVLTRAINSKAKKRTSPTKAALIAFFVAAALVLIITTFTMGVGKGFIYIPYLVLWLIVDIVRAQKSSQGDRPSP